MHVDKNSRRKAGTGSTDASPIKLSIKVLLFLSMKLQYKQQMVRDEN